MTNTYKIAERIIEITSVYEDIHTLCKDYLFPANPDFSVVTTQEDIEFEREKSAKEDEAKDMPVRQFSDGYLETLAVYRKISEKMPDYDTILFHGSCIAVDGVGYLFTASSGTGKSTHARLWRELLGDRAVMVNDDKPLIRLTDDGAIVYGTPWDGKHHLSSNISVPLKALCVLMRFEKNIINPITPSQAYATLMQQTYRPADNMAMIKTLSLIDKLSSSVSLWMLGCNMEIEAAKIAYEAMRGQEA